MNNDSKSYQSSTILLSWEEEFDAEGQMKWMEKHYLKFVAIVPIYIVFTYYLQFCMKTRERYELRYLIILWNCALSGFSIVGFLRLFPETVYVLSEFGFIHSVCQATYANNKVTAFWSFLFCWSKVFELGDTVLLVLRKHKLIFLHVYHHATMIAVISLTATTLPGFGRYMWINYGIHGLMYGYYALRAMKVNVPREFAMFLTTLQILQMFAFSFVAVSGIYYSQIRGDCPIHKHLTMYYVFSVITFAILFANYFFKTYCIQKNKSHTKEQFDLNKTKSSNLKSD